VRNHQHYRVHHDRARNNPLEELRLAQIEDELAELVFWFYWDHWHFYLNQVPLDFNPFFLFVTQAGNTFGLLLFFLEFAHDN